MQVLAVRDANTAAIFDLNPSIPSAASCLGSACTSCPGPAGVCCSSSIQTSPIDLVVALTAINDAPPGGPCYPHAVVLGFTNVFSSNELEVDYAITTTTQSKVVFACNGTEAAAIVIDAIAFRGAFGI